MKKGWIAGIVALVVVAVAAAGGYYLFFQSNVQSQVEQSVRRFFANPPAPYTKASYDKLDVALASRRLTIDDIVLERSTPPYVIKIGRFEATGIDTDNIQAIFDPAKYKDGTADQTVRKLADTLTLTKIDADSREAGRSTIDQLVVKGIRGRQFDVKPEPTTIAGLSERERALLLLNVVQIDSAVVDNLNTTSPQTPTGKLRRLELANFSRQGLGLLAVDELDLADPKDNTRTSWKRFELRDVPGDPWFDFIVTGRRPSDPLRFINLGGLKIDDLRVQPGRTGGVMVRIASVDLGKVDRKRLDSFTLSGLEIIEGTKGGVIVGTVEIKKLDWDQLLGLVGQRDWLQKLGQVSYAVDKFSIRNIGGVSLDAIGAKLNEIAFTGYVQPDGGKTESTITIDKFEIETAKVKDPQFAEVLRTLDYDRLVLSLDLVSSGDFKTKVHSLDKLRLYGPRVGDLNLAFTISDYEMPPPGAAPKSANDELGPVLAAKLQSLKLTWKDDSLTDRLFKAASTNMGMTVDQLREQAVMQVKAFGETYRDDAAVSAAIQAVVDYLNKPSSLVITAKPPNPPRFGELGSILATRRGPPDLPTAFKVLGITVTN